MGLAVCPEHLLFLVDYLGCEGYLRWFLILLFMIVQSSEKLQTRSATYAYSQLCSV
jgi:cytochrome c oxidase subunit IV